ncbi:uncharacterized protein LOC119735068 [Patiria miniata]|uniref:Uncharacterized protein n=1 Tax=Patiria miniata TaxID=46514 RepID=A0A914AM66_PATMI|nr:uncharacterized protein LOC119735068 [Patiria miniata]
MPAEILSITDGDQPRMIQNQHGEKSTISPREADREMGQRILICRARVPVESCRETDKIHSSAPGEGPRIQVQPAEIDVHSERTFQELRSSETLREGSLVIQVQPAKQFNVNSAGTLQRCGSSAASEKAPRLIQVQPVNQVNRNSTTAFQGLRSSNPGRSYLRTAATAQKTERCAHEAHERQVEGTLVVASSLGEEESQRGVPQPEATLEKHIHQSLGILGTQVLERGENSPKPQMSFPERQEEPALQEGHWGKEINSRMKHEVSETELEEESRKRQLNAAFVTKIKDKSSRMDSHAAVHHSTDDQELDKGTVRHHQPVPDQPPCQHRTIASESMSLPPAVKEALSLGQERGRQLLEETRQCNQMMMNCLVRHRELRGIHGRGDHSRPQPWSEGAVVNTQQPSDIVACAERVAEANDRFCENIQNEMIAGHNAWMELKRRKGMFFAAKHKQDQKEGSRRNAFEEKVPHKRQKGDVMMPSQPSDITAAPQPELDGVVWYRGRLVKLCWPHPSENISDAKRSTKTRSKTKKKEDSGEPVALGYVKPFSPPNQSDDDLDYMYRAQIQPTIINSMLCRKTPPLNSNSRGNLHIPSGSIFSQESLHFDPDLTPSNPLVWAYETLRDPRKRRKPRLKNFQRVVDARRHRTKVRKIK